MSVESILSTSIGQLEAQKTKTRQEAYAQKMGELQSAFAEYKAQKKAELDESIATLQNSFAEVIESKRAEIEKEANDFADVAVRDIDGIIANIKMLAISPKE